MKLRPALNGRVVINQCFTKFLLLEFYRPEVIKGVSKTGVYFQGLVEISRSLFGILLCQGKVPLQQELLQAQFLAVRAREEY